MVGYGPSYSSSYTINNVSTDDARWITLTSNQTSFRPPRGFRSTHPSKILFNKFVVQEYPTYVVHGQFVSLLGFNWAFINLVGHVDLELEFGSENRGEKERQGNNERSEPHIDVDVVECWCGGDWRGLERKMPRITNLRLKYRMIDFFLSPTTPGAWLVARS